MNHDDPTPHATHHRLFEDTVANLDQATVNRLRLMRRETLAGDAAPRARWLPVAAFAMAVLAIGLGWRIGGLGGTDGGAASTGSAPSARADLAADLPSEEDTALYAWLGEAPVAADGDAL